MEMQINSQKICPNCGRIYQNKPRYCRDCGVVLEVREPPKTQTNTNQSRETVSMQATSSTASPETNQYTCTKCGAVFSVKPGFMRITCPKCRKPLEKPKKPQPMMSDANKGFLMVFASFMIIIMMICVFGVDVPIGESLIISLILAFVFGDLTRNIINFPRKSENHRIVSASFWGCFIFFGLMITLGLSSYFGAFLGVVWGMTAGFFIGLGGALLGFIMKDA